MEAVQANVYVKSATGASSICVSSKRDYVSVCKVMLCTYGSSEEACLGELGQEETLILQSMFLFPLCLHSSECQRTWMDYNRTWHACKRYRYCYSLFSRYMEVTSSVITRRMCSTVNSLIPPCVYWNRVASLICHNRCLFARRVHILRTIAGYCCV